MLHCTLVTSLTQGGAKAQDDAHVQYSIEGKIKMCIFLQAYQDNSIFPDQKMHKFYLGNVYTFYRIIKNKVPWSRKIFLLSFLSQTHETHFLENL